MAKSRLIGDYPVIGIRPTIDGRRGVLGVRESLEDQTMNMAKSAAKLFEENLKYSNGEPVKVVIADTTIGRVGEAAACADKFRKGSPKNCIYECIVFDLNMMRRKKNDRISCILLPIINHELSINCSLIEREGQIYASVTSLFLELHAKKDFYELDVYSIIFRLFSLLYKEKNLIPKNNNHPQSKQTKSVINLIDWIDDNFTEPITLSKLSEISGLSEKYICRIFKEYTSKSPINYINELRIDCACHEIATNCSSITQAAYNSGFNDLSYFSKTFKRFKGISPHEYKKMHLNK